MPNANINLSTVGVAPREAARARRAVQRLNRARLAADAIILQDNSGLESTDDGLSVVLTTPSGLQLLASGLSVDLRVDEGLSINNNGLGTVLAPGGGLSSDATGLAVTSIPTGTLTIRPDEGLSETGAGLGTVLDPNGGINTGADGFGITLRADEGLSLTGAGLGTVIDAGGGILVDADGFGIRLDGTTLSLSNNGLRVTDPAGIWTVSAVQTANYTASINEVVRYDTSGGTFTITLPPAAGASGQQVAIKNVVNDATGLILDADGSETIDGQATQTLQVPYVGIRLISDGANWMIL